MSTLLFIATAFLSLGAICPNGALDSSKCYGFSTKCKLNEFIDYQFQCTTDINPASEVATFFAAVTIQNSSFEFIHSLIYKTQSSNKLVDAYGNSIAFVSDKLEIPILDLTLSDRIVKNLCLYLMMNQTCAAVPVLNYTSDNKLVFNVSKFDLTTTKTLKNDFYVVRFTNTSKNDVEVNDSFAYRYSREFLFIFFSLIYMIAIVVFSFWCTAVQMDEYKRIEKKIMIENEENKQRDILRTEEIKADV
jgi:hypothetical protein